MSIINVRINKYLLLLLWILFCCITFGIRSIGKRTEKNGTEGHFWVFTDSHIDIFYQSSSDALVHCHNISINNITKIIRKFGQFNCDTPTELLQSAFFAAKRIDSKVDFIIWLGDAASHHETADDTIIPVHANLSQELVRFFPNTLIIPVLGNHDIPLKTNRSIRFKEFYEQTKFDLLLNDIHARETFLKGGYYSIRYQSSLRFVVLNSAMFQPDYVEYFGTQEIIDQISWFNQTMSEAHHLNDRILLLTHVPFGIDEILLTKFYSIEYEQQLLAIIDKYSKNIIMCFTGHRHQDIFRIYSSLNTTMGILGHPSISPLNFYTDPSIRYYSYNRKSLILNDYEQYILNLIQTEQTQIDEWILSYRFSSWYHQLEELKSSNLRKLVYQIRNNAFYLKRFLLTQHYRENLTLTTHQIIQTLCSLTLFDFDELILCTNLLRNQEDKYPNMIMNYSLESNVLINEQLIQYKTDHQYEIIPFVIFLWIIYIIMWRYFRNIYV